MAFYKIAALMDVFDGCKISARAGQTRVVLVQNEGRVQIFEDRCPHMDAPLSTGKIEDGHIICRSHGIPFCLTSGKAQGPLANTLACLKFYDAVYEGNSIGIELP